MAKGDITKTQVWSDIRVDELGRVFGKRVEVIWEEQADGSKIETHRGNLYRDTIVPFVSTRDSDDEDWVLVLGDIEEPVGMTTIYRKISIDSDIDQYRWYAVTTTDKWGNQNLAISSPGNIWRVHEDTTAPEAEISVEGEDVDGNDFIAKALTAGDYDLLFKVNEMLSSHKSKVLIKLNI